MNMFSVSSFMLDKVCVSGNNIINIFLRTLSENTSIMQSHRKPSLLEFLRSNTFKFTRSIPKFLFIFYFFSFSGNTPYKIDGSVDN